MKLAIESAPIQLYENHPIVILVSTFMTSFLCFFAVNSSAHDRVETRKYNIIISSHPILCIVVYQSHEATVFLISFITLCSVCLAVIM